MNPAHRLHHRLRATQLASTIALAFLPVAWAGAQSTAVVTSPADAPDGARATPSDPAPGPRLPQVEITGTAAPMLDARPSSTSRLPMTVRETPASVVVIDRATIDAMSATNTQDILRAVPGVAEVSIGHAIAADALELGMAETVRAYQRCIRSAYA